MMMQQMQAQQMQAQQMQTAQKAALAQAQMQRLCDGWRRCWRETVLTAEAGEWSFPPQTKVNIKSTSCLLSAPCPAYDDADTHAQRKSEKPRSSHRPKVRAVPIPAVLDPAQRQQTLGAAGASALDNWQEATIILCIAITASYTSLAH